MQQSKGSLQVLCGGCVFSDTSFSSGQRVINSQKFSIGVMNGLKRMPSQIVEWITSTPCHNEWTSVTVGLCTLSTERLYHWHWSHHKNITYLSFPTRLQLFLDNTKATLRNWLVTYLVMFVVAVLSGYLLPLTETRLISRCDMMSCECRLYLTTAWSLKTLMACGNFVVKAPRIIVDYLCNYIRDLPWFTMWALFWKRWHFYFACVLLPLLKKSLCWICVVMSVVYNINGNVNNCFSHLSVCFLGRVDVFHHVKPALSVWCPLWAYVVFHHVKPALSVWCPLWAYVVCHHVEPSLSVWCPLWSYMLFFFMSSFNRSIHLSLGLPLGAGSVDSSI